MAAFEVIMYGRFWVIAKARPASVRCVPSAPPAAVLLLPPVFDREESRSRALAAPSAGARHASWIIPESSLRPRTHAGSLQIVPLFASCPSPNLYIRACTGGPV